MFCQHVLKTCSDMATSYNATKHCNEAMQALEWLYLSRDAWRSFKIELNVKFDVEWVCMVEEPLKSK